MTPLEFWNDRAALVDTAGTDDANAKHLAMREILPYLQPGLKVLDVGCGNGQTVEFLLQDEPTLKILGLDLSPAMIWGARERCGLQADFQVWDLLSPLPIPTFPGGADLSITERTLINLPDWQTQKAVILRIIGTLRPGGYYVMIENSQDGLAEINYQRNYLDLSPILPPWHNVYVSDNEVWQLGNWCGAALEDVIPFSGLYYFLSRVINAKLAADAGEAPRYDAPINQLALSLPTIEQCSQGKCWVWRKHDLS